MKTGKTISREDCLIISEQTQFKKSRPNKTQRTCVTGYVVMLLYYLTL